MIFRVVAVILIFVILWLAAPRIKAWIERTRFFDD